MLVAGRPAHTGGRRGPARRRARGDPGPRAIGGGEEAAADDGAVAFEVAAFEAPGDVSLLLMLGPARRLDPVDDSIAVDGRLRRNHLRLEVEGVGEDHSAAEDPARPGQARR